MTDDYSVNMSLCRAHSGTCDHRLLPVWRLLLESCCLVSVERPLWREDGCVVCNAITQWSGSHRTLNHTSPSHLRFPNREGQLPLFISPRNKVAQFAILATSLHRPSRKHISSVVLQLLQRKHVLSSSFIKYMHRSEYSFRTSIL
jgi:hypothetical protein